MPIKDKGTFAFVGAWAAKVVPMDIWVGLRLQTVTFTYDDQEPIHPLIQEFVPAFSYSDGTRFDDATGFKLGATKLSGECLFLKQSSSFSAMDSKCNKLKGFICTWNSKFYRLYYSKGLFSNADNKKSNQIITCDLRIRILDACFR
jgi:hypothetical protein